MNFPYLIDFSTNLFPFILLINDVSILVEIKHQVVDSGAKLVIAHPSKAADVKAAVPDIPLLTVGDGSSTLDEVLDSFFLNEFVVNSAIAMIPSNTSSELI